MTKAILISAPGSGQGKTLTTTGLVRQLLDTGKKVALFKFGPDYLDPLFLESATGLAVRQLDYWLMGKTAIANTLQLAQQEADWIVIEGMMGLFDGDFPAAQLAKDFNIPVLLTVDANGMAQTFGAVVHGLASYDLKANIIAVLANQTGSDGHGKMLRAAIKPPVQYWGWVNRDDSLAMEHRHLGLKSLPKSTAHSLASNMASRLPKVGDLNMPDWELSNSNKTLESPLAKPIDKTIAIAKDEAFNFIYYRNIDVLKSLGVNVVYFSPIAATKLPTCDALYLPGGYPEGHLIPLSQNTSMITSIRNHIEQGKPCLAECGGMLYLQKQLSWQGITKSMVGIFEGKAEVKEKLCAIGYQHLLGTQLKGHTFHHAELSGCESKVFTTSPKNRRGEMVFHYKKTIAGFVHWDFSSDTKVISDWLNLQK